MLTLFVLLWFSLLHSVEPCPSVIARHGWFSVIDHDDSCTYLLNGLPLTTSSLLTIRAYGLLQVSCNDCSFNIVSVFEGCDDCLICTHNEGIEQCRSFTLPILIAIIITTLISTLVFGLSLYLINKYQLIELAHSTWVAWRFRNRAAKTKRRAKQLKEVIEMHGLPQGATDLPLSKSSEELAPKPFIESDAVREDGICNLYPSLKHLRGSSESLGTPSEKAKIAGAVSVGLLLALGKTNVEACDATYFMSSQGVIYEDKTLSRVSSGLIYGHTGSTLCFNHPDGSEERLTISDVTLIESYEPMYETCDFSLDVHSHVSCLGTGECWTARSCEAGVRLQAVGPKAYSLPTDQVFCRLIPNLSNMECFYHQVCAWFYWDLLLDSGKCDTIYQKMQEDLIVHLIHETSKGDRVPFSLSLANPLASYPIDVHLGFIEREYAYSYQNLRSHSGVIMGTNAAGLNQGLPGLLGDLQVPLRKGNDTMPWSYPKHAVSCHPNGASISCTTPTPGYVASLKQDSLNVIDAVVSQSGRSAKRVQKVRSYLSLMIKTTPIDGQIIASASCGIRVLSTYACSSCQDLPVVYVEAIDVKQTGVMQFTSNCEFYLPEISCSGQAQALQVRGKPDTCVIKLREINETLTIKFEYEFKGQLYSRGVLSVQADESFGGKMRLAIQSPDFLNSLQISLGVGLFTTVALTIMKSLTRLAAYKAARMESQAVANSA